MAGDEYVICSREAAGVIAAAVVAYRRCRTGCLHLKIEATAREGGCIRDAI